MSKKLNLMDVSVQFVMKLRAPQGILLMSLHSSQCQQQMAKFSLSKFENEK
jgi:hypothetical protein